MSAELRQRVLETMYDATNGSTKAVIDLDALATHLGENAREVIEAAGQLRDLGLVADHGIRRVYLTTTGVLAVERSRR